MSRVVWGMVCQIEDQRREMKYSFRQWQSQTDITRISFSDSDHPHKEVDRSFVPRRPSPVENRYMKCGDPAGRIPPKDDISVSSTELRLREIKDKAAPRVAFWRLDYLDRLFVRIPASTVHASGPHRGERTKWSRGGKQ
jgi:hypothetical protein